MTRVLVKGQPYMSWPSEDEECARLAIAQLYQCGLGTEDELAAAFGRHVNSVRKYLTEFARRGDAWIDLGAQRARKAVGRSRPR